MTNKNKSKSKSQAHRASQPQPTPEPESEPEATNAGEPLTEGETVSSPEAEPAVDDGAEEEERPYVDLDAIYTVAVEAGDRMVKLAASDVRHMVEAIVVLAAQKEGIAKAVKAATTIGKATVLKDMNLEALAKLVVQGSVPRS